MLGGGLSPCSVFLVSPKLHPSRIPVVAAPGTPGKGAPFLGSTLIEYPNWFSSMSLRQLGRPPPEPLRTAEQAPVPTTLATCLSSSSPVPCHFPRDVSDLRFHESSFTSSVLCWGGLVLSLKDFPLLWAHRTQPTVLPCCQPHAGCCEAQCLKQSPKAATPWLLIPLAWVLSLLSRAMVLRRSGSQSLRGKERGTATVVSGDRKLAPRINGRPARLVPEL